MSLADPLTCDLKIRLMALYADKERPALTQATPVDPLPINGSSTTCPATLQMIFDMTVWGLTVGCATSLSWPFLAMMKRFSAEDRRLDESRYSRHERRFRYQADNAYLPQAWHSASSMDDCISVILRCEVRQQISPLIIVREKHSRAELLASENTMIEALIKTDRRNLIHVRRFERNLPPPEVSNSYGGSETTASIIPSVGTMALQSPR